MKSLLKKIKNNLFPHPKISSVEIPVFKGDLLNGKTALIIGGSGGIGSEIAKTFVENGCRVVVTGMNEAKLQNVCHDRRGTRRQGRTDAGLLSSKVWF